MKKVLITGSSGLIGSEALEYSDRQDLQVIGVETILTTAKPFRGHISIIQRDMLESRRLLHPDAEVILYGNE